MPQNEHFFAFTMMQDNTELLNQQNEVSTKKSFSRMLKQTDILNFSSQFHYSNLLFSTVTVHYLMILVDPAIFSLNIQKHFFLLGFHRSPHNTSMQTVTKTLIHL